MRATRRPWWRQQSTRDMAWWVFTGLMVAAAATLWIIAQVHAGRYG